MAKAKMEFFFHTVTKCFLTLFDYWGSITNTVHSLSFQNHLDKTLAVNWQHLHKTELIKYLFSHPWDLSLSVFPLKKINNYFDPALTKSL